MKKSVKADTAAIIIAVMANLGLLVGVAIGLASL